MPRADWTSRLPRLQSSHVTLREVAAADEGFLVPMFRDPRVNRYLAQPPATKSAFRRYLQWAATNRAAGRYAGFAIDYRRKPAGVIFLWVTAPGTAEIGFALHPSVWGTEVFTTAATLLVRFGFRTAGLHRLEMRIAIENARAQVAVYKIGARPEALLTDAFLVKGKRCDAALFRLLPSDFAKAPRPDKLRR